MTANDVASLQVSLPQMLDLALGTPEVGAVNLNILHNFLHILLHHINLKSTKVEYRGDDAKRIKTLVSSLQEGPSLYLQEYSIIDDKDVEQKRVRPEVGVRVDVIEGKKVFFNKSEEKDEDLKKTEGVKQIIGPGKDEEVQTIIYIEPIVDGAIPSALAFKQLEQNVKKISEQMSDLQQQFQALEELAKTPELIERLKGKITDPLTDVWQIINITKRLDASEQGIDKLTKMVQDMMKGDISLATTEISKLEEKITHLENSLNNLENVVKNLHVLASEYVGEMEEEMEKEIIEGAEEPHPPAAQRISLSELLGGIDIKEMHKDVATLQEEVNQIKNNLKELQDEFSQTKDEFGTRLDRKHRNIQTLKEQLEEVAQEAKKKIEVATEIKETVAEEPKEPKEPPKEIHKEPPKEIIKETPRETPKETSVESPKPAKEEKGVNSEELETVKGRISKLEKDVMNLHEKVETTHIVDASNLENLASKVQEMQGDVEKLTQTTDNLIDERETREMHFSIVTYQALLEQVELLKTIKADREDLEEALAEKADAQAIHRKVSYDQFDAACDDLAHGLEDAINKLGQQEMILQQALDEVQKEIEGKVDKIEISPLKEFVNQRLKVLQDKLKKVAEAREEIEAAGTKKLLRDVQCISCDKDVVMRMDGVPRFKVETLPCTTSMKPYLTYELDQVRKQHRKLPHSRNMIQFEAAIQEEAKKQRSARAEALVKTPRYVCMISLAMISKNGLKKISETELTSLKTFLIIRDHLCNRYCGGSHTITTPQQRVMRVGHFLTQWGPEIIQLTEGMIKGTDGRMYKSRRMPEKIDVCGPAYCDLPSVIVIYALFSFER
ncbi:glutamine-rich protein 2 [Apis mellifera]|uniref:Glutamine-rich protein 2 n=1 Tax=Apis mellifera TaxID=7460 RepID=A0A7M7L5T3_APIME|nr:glutamine-rich protein 2 [Apis mellifera]|eukprot:XP_026297181.1 glutamine-rich protein 2 [Apis mellifera]